MPNAVQHFATLKLQLQRLIYSSSVLSHNSAGFHLGALDHAHITWPLLVGKRLTPDFHACSESFPWPESQLILISLFMVRLSYVILGLAPLACHLHINNACSPIRARDEAWKASARRNIYDVDIACFWCAEKAAVAKGELFSCDLGLDEHQQCRLGKGEQQK